jgi:choline kinase
VKIENSVILAAGTGTRLKPITNKAPKCLTEINGTPIILNALENLKVCGIKRCTIVTGYLNQIIESTLGSSYRGIQIDYIKNDIFAETNDMYSLWLAGDFLEKGTVILEGDIFFRPESLKRAMEGMGKKSFYIAGKYNGSYDEILIKIGADGIVTSIDVLRGRKGEPGDLHFMSTGMLVVQPDYGKLFSQWLKKFVDKKNVNVLFDDVLGVHVGDAALHVFEISHSEWVEVDTVDDLRRAEKRFSD